MSSEFKFTDILISNSRVESVKSTVRVNNGFEHLENKSITEHSGSKQGGYYDYTVDHKSQETRQKVCRKQLHVVNKKI